MKKLLAIVALFAVAAVVPATTQAAGVDLSWTNCVLGVADPTADPPIPAPTSDANLACAAATGNATRNLLLQFKTPQPFATAASWTGFLHVIDQVPGPLPEFWRSDAPCAGTTRSTMEPGTSPMPDGCGAVNYVDPGAGGAGSPGATWLSDDPSPGRARIIALMTRGSGFALNTTTNYYMMTLQFNNRNRFACNAGSRCGDQVIVFNTLRIQGLSPGEDVRVEGPDKGSVCATIHNATAGSCAATSVRTSTWGKVKALYR
jgi:hypothetical protein